MHCDGPSGHCYVVTMVTSAHVCTRDNQAACAYARPPVRHKVEGADLEGTDER